MPSLLHGDLWGGNWGTDDDGLPVIFDPAVYYGDREADNRDDAAIRRVRSRSSTRRTQSTWPLDQAARARAATLYNLYHVLNHYNLFGGDYCTKAWAR